MKKSYAYLIGFILISLLLGCSKKEKSVPKIYEIPKVPKQVVKGSTLFCYDKNHLIWKIESDYSRRYMTDTSSMLVVPVNLTIYDTTSDNFTKVYADSGKTKSDLTNFYIWGNVDIKNWDGLRIRSESLWWNKKTRRVGSDDFVSIKTPSGDLLRGKGLDADENFQHWTLKNSVSGNFPEFKEDIE